MSAEYHMVRLAAVKTLLAKKDMTNAFAILSQVMEDCHHIDENTCFFQQLKNSIREILGASVVEQPPNG